MLHALCGVDQVCARTASGSFVLCILPVSRTLLLPTKAMEKRLEAKSSNSARLLPQNCLGRPARELRSLQLFYLCLCALCSSAGDFSLLLGKTC